MLNAEKASRLWPKFKGMREQVGENWEGKAIPGSATEAELGTKVTNLNGQTRTNSLTGRREPDVGGILKQVLREEKKKGERKGIAPHEDLLWGNEKEEFA